MNSATVNTLETLIRARLNLTNMATVSSTDMKLFIRSSLKELYNKVTNKHRDMYIRRQQLSLVAGQDTYALPADFKSEVAVWLIYGSGVSTQRQILSKFTLNQYQNLPASILLSPQWPMMYSSMGMTSGNEIWFTPTPSQNYTGAVEILYTPQWNGPVNDDSPVDALLWNGAERWVEQDVCMQVCQRLNKAEGWTMAKTSRDEAEQTVMMGVAIRDEQPQYMTDSLDTPWQMFDAPGTT